MHHLIQSLNDWYVGVLDRWGYWAVALLMAAESTALPVPSEVIIPPAAYKGWSGTGLALFGSEFHGMPAMVLLVIFGAAGSWLGASIMYWIALAVGRPVIERYGSYVLIPPKKLEGAELWTARYGSFGIFAARLLPVIRHLIGIPAGIVRMNFLKYSIYTLAGSAVWTAVLCWLGITVGSQITKGEMHKVTFTVVAFLGIIGALYFFFVHRQMKKQSAPGSSGR